MKNDNLGDWRIGAVTTLAQDVPAAYPGGPSHKTGTAVYRASCVKDRKHNVLGFVIPSPTCLALDVAIKSANAARELRESLSLRDVLTPWGEGKSVANEDLAHLYDLFEHCMVAVIASFQAIEMFCNEVISLHVKGTFDLNRKKQVLTVTGEELERVASTDEKVGYILPKLLRINSPKGMTVWEGYLDLKEARDATVHFKSKDAGGGSDLDRESLFFQFLRRDTTEFPRLAFAIIGYFQREKAPRWAGHLKELIEDKC